MNYKHISIEELAYIKKLQSERTSIRAISRYLDRSPSTISRELNRNKGKIMSSILLLLKDYTLNVRITMEEKY